MKLSVNSFYTWLKNKDLEKVETPTQFLKRRISVIFNENRQVYGAARLQKVLEREGLVYCRSYCKLPFYVTNFSDINLRRFLNISIR